MVCKPLRRGGRSSRRRRLLVETLDRRELLAVGDFCVALETAALATSPSDAAGQATPLISVADAELIEGNAGGSTMRFTVSLSEASNDPIEVNIATSNATATGLVVDRIASGLNRPIYVTSPPGDTSRLFVVEQRGDIEILQLPSGQKNASPFLSIGGLATGNEQGLLGLAFHPDYANNGKFYVNLTVANGVTEIREYQVSNDPDVANPTSARLVLTYVQPFSNHNGGWMGFGPDGYLYIASGDGGSANDPGNNAQNINNLLGKMLRIDVDADGFPADPARNYSIPTSNPFVGVAGSDEIWAYGLRNPWRSSFDRETGDLYIADVGQGAWEEINVQPGSSTGGANYGWRLREGTMQTPGSVGGAKPAGAIDPVYDYAHGTGSTEGFSVSGGYVYRGPIEELRGNYFFADFVNSRIWSLRYNGDDPSLHNGTNFDDFTDWTSLLNPSSGTINSIASFGEDSVGNLYVVDLGGEIFRFTEGADYLPAATTLTFPAGVVTQTFDVTILGDRLFEGDETLTVTLSNPTAGSLDDAVAVGTIRDDEPVPPAVESIIINDGTQGRSQITSLTVTFDTEVTLGGSAFVLTNLATQQVVPSVQVNSSVENGRTVAVLTFADGSSVVSRGGAGALDNSLADARYRLDVIASEVIRVSNSAEMLADFVFGGSPTDDFFRLYGDADGNAIVDLLDFADFRQAFATDTNDANFNPGLDVEGNGVIDLLDFAGFRANFGQSL